MKYHRLTLIVFVLTLCLPVSVLHAEDADERPVLRVVFFMPSDVEPPDGVRERLKEYVDYAQMFYGKWMAHWGYPCEQPLAVKRDDEGYPEVLFVKGRETEASGRYKQLGFQGEVIEEACKKYGLDPEGQVWWIFTYKGPQRRGFRGGGNALHGGTSTSIYDPSDEGHLRLDDDLGSDEQARLKSKGSIHELGHALGLPHIGPLDEDGFGNSLMGPVIKAYRNKHPDETRVYLTEASAAMLWKHPLFSGTTQDRAVTPALDFADITFTHDKQAGKVIVAGKVVSDHTAHSVVVANESDATRNDYWRKSYVGRVGEDGTFRVEVDELDEADGFLRIVSCFDNGAIIGKTPGRGLSTGFVKKYRFADGGFSFDDGWGDPPARKSRGSGSGR